MMFNSNRESIELLNSEGPILKATKIASGFLIIDEWKKEIGLLNEEEIISFIKGEITLEDSKGRVWDYTKQNESMRPDSKKLENFIGVQIYKNS